MSFFAAIKASFFKFEALNKVPKLNFWKTVIYALLLSVFLAIPLNFQVLHIFKNIQEDSAEIAKKIPDFSIINGRIQTASPANGFIYATPSIIFTFDPEGKRNITDIENDHFSNVFSVGFLKDELILSVSPPTKTKRGQETSLVFGYKEYLNGLTGEMTRDLFNNKGLPSWMLLIIFLITIYPALITLLFTFVFATITLNLICIFKRKPFRWLDNFKIIVVSSTLPVLISMVFNSVYFQFNSTLFIFIGGLYIASKSLPFRSKIS